MNGVADSLGAIIFHKHVQIFLQKVEAEVSHVHDLRLAGALLRNLQYVCRYLDAATILPSSTHCVFLGVEDLTLSHRRYEKGIVEVFSRTISCIRVSQKLAMRPRRGSY